MKEYNLQQISVVGSSGKFLGLLTLNNLLAKLTGGATLKDPIGNICSKPEKEQYVKMETPLNAAVATVLNHNILFVDDGSSVRLITKMDLLGYILSQNQ
jgi:predicted transcriptional regulator